MAQTRKKTEPEAKQERRQREVEARQAQNFSVTYSNNINLRMTPWDIQLLFGDIVSMDETKMVIENHLQVYLSPQTAKALAKALMATVQQYEAQIGEIKYGEIKVELEPE